MPTDPINPKGYNFHEFWSVLRGASLGELADELAEGGVDWGQAMNLRMGDFIEIVMDVRRKREH